ncbi:HepT-like ribonuclease domain-containing protein [Subtercola boreus]|uniref:HepT-like ribonuclease domain-containing protein n=1 Tax=Subtercola boreus TaxID=120213 RepID=UPI001558E461|nr:HepT-like ribonuclease domain-containing protein [Subtercola boreus]
MNPEAREAERWERVDRTLEEVLDRLTQLEALGVRGRAQFDDESTLISLAAHSLLIQVGEAAKDLPEAFRSQHGQVSWKSLIGIRDRAAHLYNLIDWDVIFTTIVRDIPRDRAAVETIVRERGARPGI